MGMEFAEKTSYKRGATDFSSQVARMKAAGCDFVVLGTIIRETIGTIGESRKTGFSPTFLGSSAAYTDLIHKLGGKAMDGLYATMTVQNPYLDEASQPISFWANKYKTKFNEDPTVFSVYGYNVIDASPARRRKAGPEPHDRQLHQGDGHDDVRARHVRQRAGHVHADQAARQRPVAPVADRRTGAGRSSPTTSSRIDRSRGRRLAPEGAASSLLRRPRSPRTIALWLALWLAVAGNLALWRDLSSARERAGRAASSSAAPSWSSSARCAR